MPEGTSIGIIIDPAETVEAGDDDAADGADPAGAADDAGARISPPGVDVGAL